MTLKDQMTKDIDAVFLNTDEFAEEMVVSFGGWSGTVKGILADDADQAAGLSQDGGLRLGTATLHIAASDLPKEPAEGRTITVKGKEYTVLRVGRQAGMLEIRLEIYEA